MAITTKAELETAIGHWMFESGTTISDHYNTIIPMVEGWLNHGMDNPYRIPALRVADMEKSAALAFDANGDASLPSDFLELRDLAATTSPVRYLEPTTRYRLNYNYPVPGGSPGHYHISGSTIRVLAATSGGTIYYYGKIPALTDAAPTNWLLTKAPNIYLYGGCFAAALFQGDTERKDEMGPMFASAVSGYAGSDSTARWSRGVARVLGPTP